MRDYTKIEAWKLADDLTVAIYDRTRSFPREEMYGLTSQLRRAAFSVPAGQSAELARALTDLTLTASKTTSWTPTGPRSR